MRIGTVTAMASACALGVVVAAQGPALDDAAVAGAIQAGSTKQWRQLSAYCVAGPSLGDHISHMGRGALPTGTDDVYVSGAAGHIATIAADAKRLYKPFDIKDVTPALRDTSVIFVTVEPRDPKPNGSHTGVEYPAPIERVVLKSKVDANRVAQPTDVQLENREFSNLLGGKLQSNAATATFSASDVKGLPPGDFDVVLITSAGERRCKINQKERDRLFGGM